MRCFILLLVMYNLLSCSHKTTNKRIIHINLEKDQTNHIEDIFSEIEIVPLETNEHSIIQTISKVIEHDSCLYILDSRQKSLFIFDHKGLFINKINTIGRAPNEYYLLDDFTINKYSKTIECLDPMGKILTYNLQGDYLSTIYLPHPPMAYHYLLALNKDSILLYTNPTPNNDPTFRVYSRQKDAIVTQFAKQKRIINGGCLSPIVIYQDTIYFAQALHNDIQYISKDTLLPAYEWNYGECTYDIRNMRLPDLTTSEAQIQFYNNTMFSERIPYILGLNSQNDKYFFSSLFMKEKIVNNFYNKETKKKIVFTKSQDGIGIYPYYMDNEKIIGITYENLVPISSFQKAKDVNIINQEIISALTEDSNPVLIKYFFK